MKVDVNWDVRKLNSIMEKVGNKIAILSCLRCNCFVDAYKHGYLQSGKIPEGYILLSDSNCTSLPFPFRHMSTATMDSISEDIYNLVLVKKDKGEIKSRIIEVKESNKIEKIAIFFLKNKKGRDH